MLDRHAAARLGDDLEQRRASIVDAIVDGAATVTTTRSLALNLLAGDFVDRLGDALDRGDADRLVHWIASFSDNARCAEARSLFVSGCAVVGARARPADADGQLGAFLLWLTARIDELLASRAPSDGCGVGSDRDAPAGPGRPRAEAITALLAVLDARDPASGAHVRAVASWCARIARALGFSHARVAFVESCALLHDIGKIATPETILRKPARLSESEWVTMRDHAAQAGEILERIESLREFAPVVRAHHERIDGAGYPDGLAGAAIPLVSRILAVADAFHAMISDRPYRPAMTPQEALAELGAGRDTHWDGAFIDALVGLVRPIPCVTGSVEAPPPQRSVCRR
jgi:putative nucleotidyltransferase with HDIG domain